MSERWKPKQHEVYFRVQGDVRVVSDVWVGGTFDERYLASGNCFETREQAEAAAAKVKELFLSMYSEEGSSSDQLPKLTIEVFDRPDCPNWAKYAAVDVQGLTYWYQYLPSADERIGVWSHLKSKKQFINQLFDSTDWQHSLIERPAKLPDWCKVGKWVWFKGSTHEFDCYACVTEINEKGVYGKCPDGKHFYSKPDGLARARLRPYDAEEMQKLVGKVLELDGNRDLVASYDRESGEVYFDFMWMSADELIFSGYTIDGGPCGKLEHKDGDDWVE